MWPSTFLRYKKRRLHNIPNNPYIFNETFRRYVVNLSIKTQKMKVIFTTDNYRVPRW